MNVAAKRAEIIAAVTVATIVLLVVSLAAGAQSWGHMYDWARLNKEPHWRALLFPIGVDGAIIASTVVLYIDHRLQRPGHKLAQVLLAVGVIISVVANVLHDMPGVVAAKSISAIGPLCLFGIFHLFGQFIGSLAGVLPPKTEKAQVSAPLIEERRPAMNPPRVTLPELPDLPALPLLPRARPGRVRRTRRPARLAGRSTTRKAPQPATQPDSAAVLLNHTAPPRPPAVVDLHLPPMNTHVVGNIVDAVAAGQLKVDDQNQLVPTAGAPAAAQKRDRVTATRKPRTGTAGKSRKQTAVSKEDATARATAYWRAAPAGAKPSARQLAEHSGLSKTSAWRLQKDLEQGATA